MQCLIQSSDECVDVVASPVTDPAEILTVALVSRLIGKIHTRIEIVIQMNAVYVVILDDLSRTVYDKLLHRRNTGIEVVVIVVLDYPLRVLLGRTGIRDCVPFVLAVNRNAVWVDPRVQLQTALVRCGYPVAEDVKAAVRCLTSRAADVAAPREQLGRIQRICGRPHLQEDRVQAHCGNIVQLGIGLGLELVGGHALLGGKINIMYGRDPDTAHIVLCGLSGVSARYHQHGQRQHDG